MKIGRHTIFGGTRYTTHKAYDVWAPRVWEKKAQWDKKVCERCGLSLVCGARCCQHFFFNLEGKTFPRVVSQHPPQLSRENTRYTYGSRHAAPHGAHTTAHSLCTPRECAHPLVVSQLVRKHVVDQPAIRRIFRLNEDMPAEATTVTGPSTESERK